MCTLLISGTSAKVRIILSGENGETYPRLMWDNKRKVLQTAAVDVFIMATSAPLGKLSHLRCPCSPLNNETPSYMGEYREGLCWPSCEELFQKTSTRTPEMRLLYFDPRETLFT